jgi:TPR repeat protein
MRIRHATLLIPLYLLCIVAWGADSDEVAAQLQAATIAHDEGHFDAARKTFERLAREGVPAAHYDLAVMHLRGELPQASNKEAVRLMTFAAEHGFVTAMVDLGRLYETRIVGAPDLAEANRWYLRAAQAGSVDAQSALGTAYYLGRGAPKDYAQAAHWFREAAKGGDVGTQYLLASMYEAGDGVAQDLRLARYWYDIAARNGDIAAPSKVKQLDAQLGEPEPAASAPRARP